MQVVHSQNCAWPPRRVRHNLLSRVETKSAPQTLTPSPDPSCRWSQPTHLHASRHEHHAAPLGVQEAPHAVTRDGPDPPPPVDVADKWHPEALFIGKPWRCSSSSSSQGAAAAEAAATMQQQGHDEASHCSSRRRRAHAMGLLLWNVAATQQPTRAAAATLTMDDARPCVLCRRPSGSTSPARPNAAGSAVGRAECGSRPEQVKVKNVVVKHVGRVVNQ